MVARRMPTKVLDVELAEGAPALTDLGNYDRAIVLVRWRGRPLGCVTASLRNGRLDPSRLEARIDDTLGPALDRARVEERLFPRASARERATLPSATVIVCTRDRPDDLARCLERLMAHRPRDVTILVVDNAPRDARTAAVARELDVAYVCEPRPGLGWARTRGIESAESELVLFTDDDVMVDSGWVDALRRPFADADVAAVTGLVMPFELESTAQERFEEHLGFARGFERRELDAITVSPLAAGTVGAGASMAFRRALVRQLGLFALELGAGSAASSGEDTYAFYRILSLGHRIVYTPDAVAWHRHRLDDAALARQLHGYGVGTACFLLRCLIDHGEGDALGSAWWHARRYFLPRLWRGWRGDPGAPPLAFTLAELRGWLAAPAAYVRSRRRERAYRRDRAPS
jgi:GT2 family glycosyltransferase